MKNLMIKQNKKQKVKRVGTWKKLSPETCHSTLTKGFLDYRTFSCRISGYLASSMHELTLQFFFMKKLYIALTKPLLIKSFPKFKYGLILIKKFMFINLCRIIVFGY